MAISALFVTAATIIAERLGAIVGALVATLPVSAIICAVCAPMMSQSALVPSAIVVKAARSAVVVIPGIVSRQARSSHPVISQCAIDATVNADGSVDVYFGPKAPAGKESHWVPTKAGGQFEVLFRFYGPEKPLFDKTWKLPDIEKTQ